MGYPGRPHGHQPRYPGRMTWVATPPPGVRQPRPVRRTVPYPGPPAYPAPPRWGFPRLTWRTPSSVPGTVLRVPRTPERLARTARAAMSVLWMVAISALLAGAGEIWRYVLLVLGRDEALPPDVVAVSDAFVTTGAVLALLTGVVALVLTLRWLLAAREIAADRAGYSPGRPDWQVLVGVLVPGLNLFVAGSVLAELEHTAVRATGSDRPRPSRLVLAWWAAWALGELLAVTTLLLGLRTSVQGRADGVLWHAATDLTGVVAAVLTALVVAAITGLVGPVGFGTGSAVRALRGLRPVKVVDAPEPPLRPHRPAGSAR